MALSREIEEFVDCKLRENGFELVEIQYLKEAGRWVLRVYMDTLMVVQGDGPQGGASYRSGVTLDDCENMSEVLGRWLETTTFFMNPYVLEISSPGINRTIKTEAHFHKFIGEKVKVSLYAPMTLESKQKNFSGVLVDCKDQTISLQDVTSVLVQIPMDKIAKAHLNII